MQLGSNFDLDIKVNANIIILNQLGRQTSPMLHYKPTDHRPSVSGEDFKWYFTTYMYGGHWSRGQGHLI